MRYNSRAIATFAAAAAIAACGGSDSGGTPVGPGQITMMKANVTLDSLGAVDVATAVRPAVIVTGNGGVPRSGVQVTFRVVSGGGTLTDSVVSTNAAGVATLGSWLLGATPTTNVIEATAASASPVQFTVSARWTRRLATTGSGACALSGTTMYCWGDDSHLEFGFAGAPPSSATPVATPLALTEIYGAFGFHLCGLTATRSAVCWGRGIFGQLGRGTSDGEANAAGAGVVAAVGAQWASLSPGRLMTCGVLTTGAGYCWGSNQNGETGDPAITLGAATKILVPNPVAGGLTFRVIAAGWLHACGIATTGDTYCWGENTQGQLGVGSNETPVVTPRKIAGTQRFATLAIAGRFTCGLTVDGAAYCWGANNAGQLGDGTRSDRNAPVAVLGGMKFTSLAAGSIFSLLITGIAIPGGAGYAGHVCGLTEAGRAYCWGWNAQGQIGDASVVDRLTPTPVSGSQTFNGLSLSEATSCGIRGAKVWCWGNNSLGQIGDGTQVIKLIPTSVSLP